MSTKRGFILVLYSILISLQAGIAVSGTLAGSGGVVSGTVIDSASGVPLIGANVRVAGLDLSARSDRTGAFVLQNIPAGRCTLRVSFVGYQTQSIEGIEIRGGAVTDIYVRMEAVLLTGQDIIVEGAPQPPVTPPAASA